MEENKADPKEEVYFRWEKSSNGSTDSLLESSDELDAEVIEPIENEPVADVVYEPEIIELFEEVVKNENFVSEELENLRELNPSAPSVVSVANNEEKSPELFTSQEEVHEEEEETIPLRDEDDKRNQNWLSEHNRFDYPDYSRVLISLNSNSYHRLPLAITESYINVKNGKKSIKN